MVPSLSAVAGATRADPLSIAALGEKADSESEPGRSGLVSRPGGRPLQAHRGAEASAPKMSGQRRGHGRADDFENGVSEGKIVDIIEYQDARGFVLEAQAFIDAASVNLKVSNRGACGILMAELEALKMELPFVAQLDRTPTKAADLRQNLVTQVCAPVRWIECVQKIVAMGASRAAEVGCGKVLSGLAKKIEPDKLMVTTLNSMDDLRLIETALKEAGHA